MLILGESDGFSSFFLRWERNRRNFIFESTGVECYVTRANQRMRKGACDEKEQKNLPSFHRF